MITEDMLAIKDSKDWVKIKVKLELIDRCVLKFLRKVLTQSIDRLLQLPMSVLQLPNA